MAKKTIMTQSKTGLKSVLILTLATVLFFKPQRVHSRGDLEISSIIPMPNSADTTKTNTSVCPDYCQLTSDRGGRGKAPFRMWYFDMSEQECKRFQWKGRGGNRNRFRKQTECQETCFACISSGGAGVDHGTLQEEQGVQEANEGKDPICSLPFDEGRCISSESSQKAIQPQLSWYFDTDSDSCNPFVYYGCRGNNNRFISQLECNDVCVS